MAHLDLESCAISLATRVLPLLLTRSSNLARYWLLLEPGAYPINNLIIDSFILESDEETGGPGGKALAQLAVFLFTSALNNDSNEGDIHKSSKGKRLVEHDFLGIPPPPKKMAVLNEELDMMLSTPKSGTVQIISIQMLYFSSSMLKIKL